jgi:predicted nucleotidyltransferase
MIVPPEILKEATRRLVERFRPTRIILFGSHARGTADHRSDVDLLVICPIAGRRRDLMRAMDQVLSGMGMPRDVIVLTPEEFERDRFIPGTVARPAFLEGEILYDSAAG